MVGYFVILNQARSVCKMRRYYLLVCLCLTIFLFHGCATGINKISTNNIQSITVTRIETNKSWSCSDDQIKSFAEAYDTATLYSNNVGTTHPYLAKVTFTDGTILDVWGGTLGFLTIDSKVTGQQNIRSTKLEEWFLVIDKLIENGTA